MIPMEDLDAIVERARVSLSAEDHEKLKMALATLGYLTEQLEAERVSLKRLKRWLFGPSSEKTSQVVPPAAAGESSSSTTTPVEPAKAGAGQGDDGTQAARRKGHGRNGAADYRGADKIVVAHGSLKTGQCCPKCPKGKVYTKREPAVLVRVVGQPPLKATLYELERLRCNLCGEVFTAEPPPGVGTRKYDETAASQIGLLRYGTGLPHNRLAHLQASQGIPLPAATQWEIVEEAAEPLAPVYDEHVRQAAQGDVLFNDDTSATILELADPKRRRELWSGENNDRTGIFTSGIVSQVDGHRIALFLTGMKHAGENLADVLRRRTSGREPPIQMCDALSRNLPRPLQTILANCLAHGRRHFVDVADNFPEPCRHVLEILGAVYQNDQQAREQGLSPQQRLRWHQKQSGLLMGRLKKWMKEQLAERAVEPNSGLGGAMRYMLDHWAKLTLFLRVAGAPLDNNVCERALKKAIRHRKNSLFYKTMNGARVGDLFMTLIHTAELARVDAFDYLTELLRHPEEVARSPAAWMPWNYAATLGRPSVT
jgi:transposase